MSHDTIFLCPVHGIITCTFYLNKARRAMSTRAPIVDGLWLCFRPSFGRLFSRPSRFSSPLNNGTTCNKRAYSSSTEYPSTRFSHPPGKNVPSDIWAGDAERNTNTASNSASHDYSQIETTLPANIEKNNSNAFKKKRWPKKKPRPKELPNTKVLLKKRGAPKNLRNKSDTKLENFLQSVVERHPNHSAALRVVRELVEHRNIEPKPRHYKAMVLANVDNLRGSAIQVKMLLEEMDKSDIVLDSGTLHAAIRVNINLAAVVFVFLFVREGIGDIERITNVFQSILVACSSSGLYTTSTSPP